MRRLEERTPLRSAIGNELSVRGIGRNYVGWLMEAAKVEEAIWERACMIAGPCLFWCCIRGTDSVGA
jgi:hypothetical protein